MQRLWAPWRETYVSKIPIKKKSCVFCRLLKDKQDEKNFVFIRQASAYGVLNLYPYNTGHCLIVPNRHVADISALSTRQYHQLMDLLCTTKRLLGKVFAPQGCNIGINVGPAAGAGIPGHVHIHIVPRWQGDHNFMPVVSDTRIIPQSLKSAYQRIVHEIQKRH